MSKSNKVALVVVLMFVLLIVVANIMDKKKSDYLDYMVKAEELRRSLEARGELYASLGPDGREQLLKLSKQFNTLFILSLDNRKPPRNLKKQHEEYRETILDLGRAYLHLSNGDTELYNTFIIKAIEHYKKTESLRELLEDR